MNLLSHSLKPSRTAGCLLRDGLGILLLALPLGFSIAAHSQAAPAPNGLEPDRMRQHFPDDVNDRNAMSDERLRLEVKKVRQLNALRQKTMVSDAEKLLHLAQQLNDDEATGRTTLTPGERLRMAAEIERLAREVKDKMSFAVTNNLELAPSWQFKSQ